MNDKFINLTFTLCGLEQIIRNAMDLSWGLYRWYLVYGQEIVYDVTLYVECRVDSKFIDSTQASYRLDKVLGYVVILSWRS